MKFYPNDDTELGRYLKEIGYSYVATASYDSKAPKEEVEAEILRFLKLINDPDYHIRPVEDL